MPHIVVEAVFAQFSDIDGVGFLEHFYFFGGDIAQNADTETGSGERVTVENIGRDAQFLANAPQAKDDYVVIPRVHIEQ